MSATTFAVRPVRSIRDYAPTLSWELTQAAREHMIDVAWGDPEGEDYARSLGAREIGRWIERYYCGGTVGFIADHS
jgi:hypothetical protein